jgi:hypothetical protein
MPSHTLSQCCRRISMKQKRAKCLNNKKCFYFKINSKTVFSYSYAIFLAMSLTNGKIIELSSIQKNREHMH